MSAAVNELVRRGQAVGWPPSRFVQRTSSGHARLDITDLAEVLELLGRAHHRVRVGVCSADTDFARFDGLRWVNPLRAGGA